METVPSPAQETSSHNPDTVKSEDGNSPLGGGRSSPPPNCAICLGTCRNKSFTDSCLHQFCFKCLLTWSKVKAECPLCKQNFKSIIHNVRSNHQYEQYMVEQRTTENINERVANVSRTFRYSTTLTLPRHDSIAIQQLLVQHYPLMANVFPGPARRRRSPLQFRRTVYRHNLWARPLPDFTGRFRDCSPHFYRYNDTQLHRLMPWLSRELVYLLNDNQGHITYVMSRILELLVQYHINSPEFKQAMQRYFGERTEHFLHELYCFASTPYDMTGYDRNVQYTTDARVSTVINELVSSSDTDMLSSDSDIVMISDPPMPAEPPAGPSRVPVYPQNYIPNPTDNNVIPIETISHSDSDDDSEVMVVGYIKPPQDRTPEIVDLLGSDSDVLVQEPQPEPGVREPPENPREISENRAGYVKVRLTCHRPPETPGSGSDTDDSAYTPPRPRRKWRPWSSNTATTTDTSRTTPSRATSSTAPSRTTASSTTTPSRDSGSRSRDSESTSYAYSTDSSTTPTTSYDSDSSTDSYCSSAGNRRVAKRKMKRKKSSERSKKKCKRSKSRSHPKEVKTSPSYRRQTKRKSYSGKGVKSSKKSPSTPKTNADQPQPQTEEPVASTSGVTSRKESSNKSVKAGRPGESKRLKSVVRVIKSKKPHVADTNGHEHLFNEMQASCSRGADDGERSANSHDGRGRLRARTSSASSDSEDNIPLNLTIQKIIQGW